MYKVTVEGNFSSAHNLRQYKGKCEELHGHNWTVQATASKHHTEQDGMVVDFTLLKKKLYEVLEQLDHRYINKVPYFKKVNPTSENIARFIFDSLKSKLPDLSSVTVWENEKSCATYEP